MNSAVSYDFPVLNAKISCPPLPKIYINRSGYENITMEGAVFILLSAPPGYGKSTMLVSLFQQLSKYREMKGAWFSIDGLDNDPWRFCAYLDKALQKAGLPAKYYKQDQNNDNKSVDILLYLLQSIEEYGKPFLLVFDDFHEISNPFIIRGLQDFLDYLPTNCTVAIAAREDPPLHLSVHRQEDRLLEVRVKTLQATEQETLEYLTMMGVDAGREGNKIIAKKTMGWWTCIKLFALAWKELDICERSKFLERFRGTDRFIAEFIMESFYSALPVDLAEFAAIAAVPDFFNEDLCLNLVSTLEPGLIPCSVAALGANIDTLKKMGLVTFREGTARYRFHLLLT